MTAARWLPHVTHRAHDMVVERMQHGGCVQGYLHDSAAPSRMCSSLNGSRDGPVIMY
jgi:hypothetical protein